MGHPSFCMGASHSARRFYTGRRHRICRKIAHRDKKSVAGRFAKCLFPSLNRPILFIRCSSSACSCSRWPRCCWNWRLTQVLSVSLWYHFGFLVISTALLGFGASGVTLALWTRLRERGDLGRSLAACALCFACSTLLSFWLMQHIPIGILSPLLSIGASFFSCPFISWWWRCRSSAPGWEYPCCLPAVCARLRASTHSTWSEQGWDVASSPWCCHVLADRAALSSLRSSERWPLSASLCRRGSFLPVPRRWQPFSYWPQAFTRTGCCPSMSAPTRRDRP